MADRRKRSRRPQTTDTSNISKQMEKRRADRKARRGRRSGQKEEGKPEIFLSTGATLLNLAMTDSTRGGWPAGRISTMPGASAAGKSIQALSSFTEACLDSRFDEYDLIYDDTERRCDFNLQKLFPPLVPRLMTPSGLLYSEMEKSDETGMSVTIEDLRNRMLMLKKKGTPFIYVGDSLDAYTTSDELEKEYKRALAAAKSEEAAKKIAGSYNTEKAKILGQILRMIAGVVADTNSIFILTQQLRQRVGGSFGQSKYITSGGEAPFFYSHVRPFLTKVTTHKEKGRKIGVRTRAVMDKNSITGKLRDVEYDIYYDMGVDDVGSMVQFLLDEKHWKSGSWIEAPELDLRENGRDKLVRAIEDNDLEPKLKRIVQRVWNDVEESLKLNRKPRY